MKFMINYLQSSSREGKIITDERKELEALREELKKLKEEQKSKQKKNQNKEDKENKSSSKSSDEEEEKDVVAQQDFDNKIIQKRNNAKIRGARASVSAEAFGFFNKKTAFKPRVIPKKAEQIEAIKTKCLQSFLFNPLEEQELNKVIGAFEEKRYKEGDYVIKQGDQGDVLYLVDSGELICEKVFKKGDPPTYLKTYKPGESFGELALLYNAPRAATIKAKTSCILWALDRGTFNHIVKEAAVKKRNKYESTLKSIPILSTIDGYELSQICDAVKNEKADKGTYIIKEGEIGDKFYILDEGEAYAEKTFNPAEGAKKVKDYKHGDYFGELALLRNEPRAASIVAKTDCKLLVLDRLAFKRLLGPLEKILQRNSDMYAKYNKQFEKK